MGDCLCLPCCGQLVFGDFGRWRCFSRVAEFPTLDLVAYSLYSVVAKLVGYMCVQLFLNVLLFGFVFSCGTVRFLSFVSVIGVVQSDQIVKCVLMMVVGVLDVEGE